VSESLIGELKYRCALKVFEHTNDPLSIYDPKWVALQLRMSFDEIPQAFVRKQYLKLKRILVETVECLGDYGPTATALISHSRKTKDDTIPDRAQEQLENDRLLREASESDSDYQIGPSRKRRKKNSNTILNI
jgi:hypothetical protein